MFVFQFTAMYSVMFLFFPVYWHILCNVYVCFPVYCHVLCEVCQQISVDPMIIQPILEELGSSLQGCLSTEAARLPLLQKEKENLKILAITVDSLEKSKRIPSLGFDGEIFSALVSRSVSC